MNDKLRCILTLDSVKGQTFLIYLNCVVDDRDLDCNKHNGLIEASLGVKLDHF